MKRCYFFTSLLTLIVLLSGCVSKKELVSLQTDYDKLKARQINLKADYDKLNKSYQDAQIQLVEARTAAKGLEERLTEAN